MLGSQGWKIRFYVGLNYVNSNDSKWMHYNLLCAQMTTIIHDRGIQSRMFIHVIKP